MKVAGGMLLASLLATVGAAAQNTRALDEATVARIALESYPAITAAQETRAAAESARTHAAWMLVPELELSAHYTRFSSIPERYRSVEGVVFPQLLDSLGARMTLTIPITDSILRLADALRAADEDVAAARLEMQVTRAEVVYRARVAFLNFWGRSLSMENAAELVRAAQSNVEDQRRRLVAGTVARNQVLPFESALDTANMQFERMRAEWSSAESTLRAYLPDVGDAPIEAPPLPDSIEAPSGRDESSSEPPQVRVMQARSRAAGHRASSASLGRVPRLLAYGIADVSAPSPRVFILNTLEPLPTWEVGVRLQWTLSQLAGGTLETEQASHEQAAWMARAEDTRRQLVAERRGTIAIREGAERRLVLANARVEHAEALVAARRGELEAGTALPLDVVLAEADLTRAKDELVAAFVDRAVASARLDFLDGREEVER